MKKVVLFKGATDEYKSACSDNNFEAIFVEPLLFIYKNLEELNTKLAETCYEGVILTSPRAIEALAKCWDPAKFVIWNSKKVYTVGHSSSNLIKCLLGLDAIGMTSGNAENLARIIMSENEGTSRFLFPCGNLRSETIPALLQSKGISVDCLTVYETNENENLRMDLISLSTLPHKLCGMVFFSPSGCEYIHRQLQTFANELSLLPHFAIGNSTARKIETLGLEIAGVAAKPQADSVVECLNNYFTALGST